MLNSTKQKALRLILTSLLDSPFSNSELLEIAGELEFGSLSSKLAVLVEDAVRGIGAAESKSLPTSSPSGDELDRLSASVTRKRMSKARLLALLRKYAEPKSVDLLSREGSNRAVLAGFLRFASRPQVKLLMQHLDSEPAVDPYLRGITERGR